jgi:hypothetical protein
MFPWGARAWLAWHEEQLAFAVPAWASWQFPQVWWPAGACFATASWQEAQLLMMAPPCGS